MAKIWAERIIAGTRTLEEVPNRYKESVKAILLDKMGEQWLESYLNPPKEDDEEQNENVDNEKNDR